MWCAVGVTVCLWWCVVCVYGTLHCVLTPIQQDNENAKPLPSWETIKDSTLGALYTQVMKLREECLREAESAAISFDGWEAELEQGRLIGIHYHWVDREWRYRSALLDLVEAQGSETGVLTTYAT